MSFFSKAIDKNSTLYEQDNVAFSFYDMEITLEEIDRFIRRYNNTTVEKSNLILLRKRATAQRYLRIPMKLEYFYRHRIDSLEQLLSTCGVIISY